MALVGARGASEYIARSASTGHVTALAASTNFLKGIITYPATFNTFSFACQAYIADITANTNEILFALSGYQNLTFLNNGGEDLNVDINGISIRVSTDPFATIGWKTIFVNYDGLDFYAKTDTTDATTGSGGARVVNGGAINTFIMGVDENVTAGTDYDWKNHVSSCYFSTDIIDFSQESNRNLFVNQLGYPRDLTPEIEAGTIPTPLIYLPFDDTTNLGKNMGTGGDFTVVGTVTAGADFTK